MSDPDDSAAVTAEDVAAAAGVSRWTVARAFKHDASISKRSRDKVMAAAEALGYVPDLMAAGLAADRTNLVALIFDDFENPHKLLILERLTRAFQARGWATLVINSLGLAGRALISARQRRVDAAVLIGTQFDDAMLSSALSARHLKQLVVFSRASGATDTISIHCDDVHAMGEIAELVVAKGRRRPLFLAGPDTQSTLLLRKAAFVEHWRRLGGGAVPVVHVDAYRSDLAYARLIEVLRARRGGDAVDVVVCENDIIAIGAMDALRYGLGLRVPADVGVTGYDDAGVSSAPAYDLTTYRQPMTAMAEALVEILEKTDAPPRTSILRGHLVVRGSV